MVRAFSLFAIFMLMSGCSLVSTIVDSNNHEDYNDVEPIRVEISTKQLTQSQTPQKKSV